MKDVFRAAGILAGPDLPKTGAGHRRVHVPSRASSA